MTHKNLPTQACETIEFNSEEKVTMEEKPTIGVKIIKNKLKSDFVIQSYTEIEQEKPVKVEGWCS